MSNLALYKGEGTRLALKPGAKSMAAALRDSSQEGASTDLPEGGVYISFSGKMGRYSIGTDKEDADPAELWLVNVFEFQDGWMCWKNGQPVAKRFASAFGDKVDLPNFSEHGPFKEGEGWNAAKALMCRSMSRGIQGYYSTSTKSAVREMSKLIGEIARRLDEGLPAWPLIQLDKEKFTAQGNTNWKPILHVAGWLAMQQVEKLASMSSNEEAMEALDELAGEAAQMEADGIPDSTMHGDGDAVGYEGDEGEDTAFVEEAEEVAEEVEEAEVIPEPTPEPSKPAPTLARKAAAQATGGLRRRTL